MQPMPPPTPLPPLETRRARRPASPSKELPSFVKGVLILKALACLFFLGLSTVGISLLNKAVDVQTSTDESRSAMHTMGQILLLLMLTQLLELIGIVATWNMKRWGVYMLAGFAMLDFALNLRAGDLVSMSIGMGTTLFVAFGITLRWKDFD
jgi:hypothetical protein